MKHVMLTLALFYLTLANAQSKSKPITEFSQKDLDNVILVDVRTPKEFEAGHLEHALNINWFDANFAEQFTQFDNKATIYLYCRKGGRSAKAQKKLDSIGYKRVVNLIGGYEKWKAKD